MTDRKTPLPQAGGSYTAKDGKLTRVAGTKEPEPGTARKPAPPASASASASAKKEG
ncbi:hypothetical protein [Maritimibacter sp. 55A14]|uniref:hypothetical protein n=1 Tax=Maritimibacter sp. 55A14 TaxID=2174844 RepID=UPI0013049B8C|nr:hypothetical protein [Maritimibacter sp. 55A14]